MTVRVRFAPSPTGFLHVGGGRTVLYNWLFARSVGGTLILRSDDTDQARSTPEYATDIVSSLRWLGLDWDEGIEVGGPHAPYEQSRRLERYRDVAHRLVAEGKGYHCFATSDQLDRFRQEAQAAGRPPAYDGRFRLPAEEEAERVAAGEPAPIRFAVPRPGTTRFDDAVRGEIAFDHIQVDDFVVLRSDGSPTYHLASTVDDIDFAITHVIRGEDLLSSTPKHVLLAEAMGVAPPIYGHLSLLMGPDGSKLSKRHGHTAIAGYREDGYLPEALRNYLAILGWSPGEDEELVPLEEMVSRFDLGAVSRNPAVFDATKLEWMNGVYLRALPAEELVVRAMPYVVAVLGRELDLDEAETFLAIAPLVQERAKSLADIGSQVRFLFGDIDYDQASWDKVMTAPEARAAVDGGRARLAEVEPWATTAIEEVLRAMLDELGLSAKKGLQPLRVAVTGSAVSPPLFESMEALGKERTLARLDDTLNRLFP